jgi:hypothetical protein
VTTSAWTSDQRLELLGVSAQAVGPAAKVQVESPADWAEMLPDGKIVYHRFSPTTPNSWVDTAVPLPDGRFVVLRTTNVGTRTMPDPSHPDGGPNPDLHRSLQIVDKSAKVRLNHAVGAGVDLRLLGATSQSAYLARPKGVYRHDFATGLETLLISTRTIGEDLSAGTEASVVGDRLVTVSGQNGKPWSVNVFDLTTGTRVMSYPLSGVAATWAGPVRLSPDGHRVAVVYTIRIESRLGRTDSRLAVVDIATQALALDRPLSDAAEPLNFLMTADIDYRVRGIAWSDDHALRMAWIHLPENAEGTYNADKLTTMRTFVVG